MTPNASDASPAGATKPTRIRSNVDVQADLDTPAEVDPDIEGALAEVKAEREADLRDKAFKEMRPVEEKMLPIIALSAAAWPELTWVAAERCDAWFSMLAKVTA